MRWLLFFLLLPFAAEAAPPSPPACVAGEEDTIFGKARMDPGDWYAVVGCKGADGKWTFTGGGCLSGVCKQMDWLTADLEIRTTADPAAKKAAFDKWWKVIATLDCDPVTDRTKAVCASIADWVAKEDKKWNPQVTPPPPPPSPPVTLYQVVKAQSNASPPGTLPVYKWDGTTRGTATIGRVPQGDPCDCSVKAPGATLYCLVLQRTDAMARCEAK